MIMRKLVTKDVFKLARIIKKGNIKQELADLAERFSKKEVKPTAERVGYEIVITIVEACGNKDVEKEIYSLLGDIFEEQDIENMSIETLIGRITQLAKENDLGSFFKLASQ